MPCWMKQEILPQIQSLQKALKATYPDLAFAEPLVSPSMAIGPIPLTQKVSLLTTLKNVSGITFSFTRNLWKP